MWSLDEEGVLVQSKIGEDGTVAESRKEVVFQGSVLKQAAVSVKEQESTIYAIDNKDNILLYS